MGIWFDFVSSFDLEFWVVEVEGVVTRGSVTTLRSLGGGGGGVVGVSSSWSRRPKCGSGLRAFL